MCLTNCLLIIFQWPRASGWAGKPQRVKTWFPGRKKTSVRSKRREAEGKSHHRSRGFPGVDTKALPGTESEFSEEWVFCAQSNNNTSLKQRRLKRWPSRAVSLLSSLTTWVQPLGPHGGSKEPGPTHCPLTSTLRPRHTHTPATIQNKTERANF